MYRALDDSSGEKRSGGLEPGRVPLRRDSVDSLPQVRRGALYRHRPSPDPTTNGTECGQEESVGLPVYATESPDSSRFSLSLLCPGPEWATGEDLSRQ